MARMWNDPQLGPIRVLSRKEINAQVIGAVLKAQGYNLNDVHCACCTLKLTDFSTIKMSTEGPVGPECSKPGHVMPCRRNASLKTDSTPQAPAPLVNFNRIWRDAEAASLRTLQPTTDTNRKALAWPYDEK